MFKKYLEKGLDKLPQDIKDKIPQDIKDKLPPSVPSSSKPPPVPTSSKPGSSSSSRTYWQADFSPHVPISANFKHETGGGGWGNNELENYTDGPENSFHTPSNQLVLRATAASHRPDNKYTSARLTSHKRLERRSGYIVASLTAPCAKGIWPAFWLLPAEPFLWPNDGEVDIFECWNGEPDNHSCLHWGHYNGEDWNKHRVAETTVSRLHEQHSYGFAWEQPEQGEGGRCIWYIDGRAVMKADRPPGTRRFEEWRIIINVAIGGDVCKGQVPSDGSYDLVVHDLKMCEELEGGWGKFERDWRNTREGHAM